MYNLIIHSKARIFKSDPKHMSFIEVSLWKNGRLDCQRVVVCDEPEQAEELYRDFTDALHKIMGDENDDA